MEHAMDLATHQRSLRSLIKDDGRFSPVGDPYLEAVAASDGLLAVREIVLWWRKLGLARSCVLTTRALRQKGVYDATVRSFVRAHQISPYAEELRQAFLAAMALQPDPLIAAVARFEEAVAGVKRGDAARYEIDWAHDPAAVLAALTREFPLEEERLRGRFRMVVERDGPGIVRVQSFEIEAGSPPVADDAVSPPPGSP